MNRETKIIEVDNHSFEMITYFTTREMRGHENISVKSISLGSDGKPQASAIDPAILNEAEDYLIKTAIISIDNNKENIVDRFLDMPKTTTSQVFLEIQKIAGIEKKK